MDVTQWRCGVATVEAPGVVIVMRLVGGLIVIVAADHQDLPASVLRRNQARMDANHVRRREVQTKALHYSHDPDDTERCRGCYLQSVNSRIMYLRRFVRL